MAELDKWDSFYVIVGSAAGALIGLQFVVMTLIAERPSPRAAEASAAFGTPTVFHFGAALFLSALIRVPWGSATVAISLCSLTGLAGLIYAIVTAVRMHTQQAYTPDLEDWLFHMIVPLSAYAALTLAAPVAGWNEHLGFFAVGGAALALLFVGIHNAWDAVAYHVLVTRRQQLEDK